MILASNKVGAFCNCRYLTVCARDVPDLSHVTNWSHMFHDAYAFNGNLSQWKSGTNDQNNHPVYELSV